MSDTDMLKKSIEAAKEEAENTSDGAFAAEKSNINESQPNNSATVNDAIMRASVPTKVKNARKKAAPQNIDKEEMQEIFTPITEEDLPIETSVFDAESPIIITDIDNISDTDENGTRETAEDADTSDMSKNSEAPRNYNASDENDSSKASESTADSAENIDIKTSTDANVTSGFAEKDFNESESEPVIPLFPASTYIAEDDEEAVNDHSDDNDTVNDDNDKIVHPDDLFSIDLTENNESCDSDIEISDENRDNLAPINDDGQYIIPELDDYDDTDEITYAEDTPSEKYDPKKPRKIDGRFDFAELFVFTLLAVMIITSFFFRHSVVQGDSMMNTLYDGEHLIISDFFYTPERGDIIVCQDHTARLNTPIVKRIIAVGGDRIKITKTDVYVNGEKQNEDYIFIDPYAMPYRYDPMPEMKVPEGEVFVMGDHRNNSKDSRDKIDLGTVSEDAILGKVLLRFYPFDKFGAVD